MRITRVLAVVALLVACQNSPTGPSGGGSDQPPPPIPPSGPYRLKDAEGKELPMTVQLITARYVNGGFQFAIETCVDSYDPAKFPNTSNNSIAQEMLINFIPSRDGVNPSYSGMGGTKVANPWPRLEPNCVPYDRTNGVLKISHDDVKFIINWGTYGGAWQGREYPNVPAGEPLGGWYVFEVSPPS